MAPTFALIQNGQLSGAADITFVRGSIGRRHRRVNTTNSGSGTTSQSTLGRWIWQLQARGYWDTGSNTYPLPVGTASSNGPIGRLSRIRLQKRQVVKNATADADGVDDMIFTKGVVQYVGRGFGYLQSTEAPLATDTTQEIAQAELSSFTIPLDGSHDVTADAVLTNIGEDLRFTEGGAVLVDFDFELTGSVTLNGTNNPLSATEFSATLEADNADQWTGTVIYEQMDADIDYENGTPVRIDVQGPWSGDPAASITTV